MFYTRGEKSPDWEGVDMVDEGIAPRKPQDFSKRTVYGKINLAEWSE